MISFYELQAAHENSFPLNERGEGILIKGVMSCHTCSFFHFLISFFFTPNSLLRKRKKDINLNWSHYLCREERVECSLREQDIEAHLFYENQLDILERNNESEQVPISTSKKGPSCF